MFIENANIIRQKRKTVKMSLDKNGQLTVCCPLFVSNTQLFDIIKKNEHILEKKYDKLIKISSKYDDIITYKKIMLLGKEYLIIPTNRVEKGYFTENTFIVPQKIYINEKKFHNYLKKILVNMAIKIIPQRVEELSKISSKFVYENIIIGNFKAKWGSCDNNKILKFNWKLIMIDSQILDFVIYHEFCHLIELNHSKNFYNLLEKICPTCKKDRKTLKELNFVLHLF